MSSSVASPDPLTRMAVNMEDLGGRRLIEANRVYESGLATLEDIDAAMKLGCGYPMGPFTLLDLVGLDTAMYVAEVMFEEFREPRYAPPPLLKRMVMAGHLGRKTGRGFYTYEGK